MKNDVTLLDIAKKHGVSQVTVSKALSGKSGVGDELRSEIIKTAKEMGYTLSHESKKRPGKTKLSVGVIASERFLREKESFYWKLYQELAIVFSKERVYSLLEVITRQAEDSCKTPELIIQGKIDVLIILGVFNIDYLSAINHNCNVPIFSIDSLYYEIDGDGVIIDNMVGGYKVTEYLIGLGHTKIGYVGTLDNTPSIDDRYMGYCKALLLHGITPNAEWLIGDRNEESLVKEAEQFTLPTKNKMPTAFFCNCDYVAQLFIDKLKMSGYRVPEDISVVGFDNYLPQIPEAMELTTYEVDIEEIAAVAVANIKKCMEREGGKPKTYVIRGRVIERKSAKAL